MQPVALVAWAARGVDQPEGIRREPKADEDEDGEVRSEGSGPQSLPRAAQAANVTGVTRTTLRNNNNNNNNNNNRSIKPPSPQ